jgi:predicted dehydrogenase
MEMDFILLANIGQDAITPWSWSNLLAQGGGSLNNFLPHLLSMLERMLQGKVTAAMGEARVGKREAPFLPGLHDYREVMETSLTKEEAAKLEWRQCDADNAFSTLLQVDTPLSPEGQTVLVSLRVNYSAAAAFPSNGWYIYGDRGVLVGDGVFSPKVSKRRGDETKSMPTPDALIDQLPEGDDDAQRHWNALARDFVADIRDQPHSSYLTFQDGWRYQAIADAIRSGSMCQIDQDVPG